MAQYVIQRMDTAPYFENNKLVSGFDVYVYYPEFEETHILRVPDNKPDTIKSAADKFLANRRKISELGGEQ
jgi:hypothetical protein